MGISTSQAESTGNVSHHSGGSCNTAADGADEACADASIRVIVDAGLHLRVKWHEYLLAPTSSDLEVGGHCRGYCRGDIQQKFVHGACVDWLPPPSCAH
ncbi:hypothetical protein GQ600_32 [Phytophthora cactorum]|nr:hypothetical protein GQ600_32 [Phytophthora cactorum]